VDDCKHDDNTKLKNKKTKKTKKETKKYTSIISRYFKKKKFPQFCGFQNLAIFSILLHFFGVECTRVKEISK
jgi:hypothetical protein